MQLYSGDLVDAGLIRLGIQAHQPDRPRVGGAEADGALDRRGLAGSVRAEDPEDLALAYRERDVIDRDQLTVRLAQMRDRNGRTARSIRVGVRSRRSSRLTS